jgi:hypothetical protein
MIGIPIELQQEYQRNKTLREFFAIPGNATKVAAYPPLQDAVDAFLDDLDDFENLLPGKDITTIGISDDKVSAKKLVAVTYAAICRTTKSFAKKINNADLRAQMNFGKAKIERMADAEILPFATEVNQKITDVAIPNVLFAPYGITPAILTTALGKATTFNGMIGKSGSVTAVTHGVIEQLEAKNLEIHEDVDDISDLMEQYHTSDFAFWSGYSAAKVIHDIGYHHSGIEGTVTKNGVPVKDVNVVCVQNGKKVDITDVVGHYEIRNFIPKTYEFKFTHAVHGEKIVVVKIERGKVVTVDVEF